MVRRPRGGHASSHRVAARRPRGCRRPSARARGRPRMSRTTAIRKIPITKPYLGPEEREAVLKPLDTGWLVQGPYVAEFERKFAEFTGASSAVATTSCTTALHMAADALGVSPGAEVIVPAFTWVSTANIIESLGGRAVFCDVDIRTYNIDVSRVADLITDRTVGILPVHLFGLCADMDPILELARARGLWVLEDSACGFGAWYH